MPTSLDAVRSRLTQRLNTLGAAFERHSIQPSVQRKIDRRALQEGLVSALWQSWSRFCRDILIASTQGAVTTTGQTTTCLHAARPEAEIAYIARQFAQRQPVGNIRPIAGSHQEPTWGDVIKLNLIISGLAPSNRTSLATAFGACIRIPDLQLCRNASAHISGDMISQVKASRVRYTSTDISHPSDMIFWVDPATSDYVWRSWVEEMTDISRIAIS